MNNEEKILSVLEEVVEGLTDVEKRVLSQNIIK